ncbi:hypothetical protein KGV31_002142 [Vibrio parahaemolyticus]|nr:hypothetical protein [Vibrio parahaemolyticus]EHU0344286.1 hypothetical protein [Vibrio parahaemolyticus]EHU0354320.1 hypothetical protein [Vibrio parahaemolyticus]
MNNQTIMLLTKSLNALNKYYGDCKSPDCADDELLKSVEDIAIDLAKHAGVITPELSRPEALEVLSEVELATL